MVWWYGMVVYVAQTCRYSSCQGLPPSLPLDVTVLLYGAVSLPLLVIWSQSQAVLVTVRPLLERLRRGV